jgi:hypothetical protein
MLCTEKKKHLRNGLYLTVLILEAVLIYYISMWAFSNIDNISKSFLDGLYSDNQSEPSRHVIAQSPFEGSSTAVRVFKDVTETVFSKIQQEMHGPLQQTISVGVFTGLTETATTLLANIPSVAKWIYRKCHRSEEEQDLHEIGEIQPPDYVLVDMH